MQVRSLIFGIAALWGLSISACAAAIVVNNANFDVLPAGGLTFQSQLATYSVGPIPGWSESGPGPTGQFDPNGMYFNSMPDGPTIAYSNGGTIYQDVGTVEAGDTYTLSVDIGERTDRPETGSADLLIDGVTYAAVGTPAAAGGWSTYTVTYSALPNDVGASIYIQLISTGAQADFTDVQLTDPSVPEPASAALVGVCFAGLLVCRRRFRPVR